MPLLETADSLMLSDPDAARQMLLSVEQGTDLRMNRSERAYYLLLMAEADYLCEKPLFRDTAVREAVRFFPEWRAAGVVCPRSYDAGGCVSGNS